MLSGSVPFKANNLNDLQNMIISGSFKEIHGISKECNDLLHKLLQINPKKRITIDEALKIDAKAIDDYLGNLPKHKFHCSILGHEALADAIKEYEKNHSAGEGI